MDFLLKNIEVGSLVWHKTRVVASYFFEVTTPNDFENLSRIFLWSQKENIDFLIISGGTNIVFSKSHFNGIIIKNSLFGWNFNTATRLLQAFSAEKIWNIAEALERDYNENIWHRFIGLPGAIAGAVVGNAGCFGLETENNFLRAQIFDMKKNEIITLTKSDMNFSYRHSFLKNYNQYFLISAEFDLSEKREKYHSDEDNIAFRENKQPKNPSCGSFFKNPDKNVSAGYLIEACGLKWKQIGGAQWSEIHANFLVSTGDDCTPENLMELIKTTQKIVKEQTGYELQNEVRIIL